MAEDTFLIVGLGNPGARYENTRHNVGFVVVDAIARSAGECLDLTKWDADYCKAAIWSTRVFFVKPQTFMNISGQSVARFVNFFNIDISNILVIHDDIDMHPGRVKLVGGGGPGGHNGIRSLIQCLGSREFFRLKYGVGRPGKDGVHPEIPVDRYVLASLEREEVDLLDRRIDPIITGVRAFVESGSQSAMNLLNSIK